MSITYKKLTCKYCAVEFQRSLRALTKNAKHHFCSRTCRGLYQSSCNRLYFNCKQCGKDCNKQNSQAKVVSNHFCSRRCSTTYRNQFRKKQPLCLKTSVSKTRWNSTIRTEARCFIQSLGWSRCLNFSECKYDFAVDACHINAVKNFAADAPIEIINTKENLVALCPNCHRRFDKDPDPTFRNSVLAKKTIADSK